MRPIGPRSAAADRPTLSVLVPALDEEATLAVVVEELLARLRPAFAFEVIVVDDGSRDGTPKLIEELCARFPELRALRHPRPLGKGAAVRSAIAEARGEPGFAIEIELTATLRRSGARFYEVPIRYRARTYAEGKKLQLRDALAACAAVLRHRFSRLD